MRAFSLLMGVALVAGAGGSLGCARGAEERQMADLREEIARVQTDRDRFEQRVNALEVLAADGTTTKRTPPSRAVGLPAPEAGTPTPKLRVVHLNPDGTEEGQTSAETAGANGEDPDDSAPRPTIRIAGTPERRDARRGPQPSRPAAQIEQTLPDEAQPGRSAPPPRPSALDPDAKRAYDAALALVNARQYPQALDAFAAFLVRWPDHPNADNATYWRGESYFAQGELSRATEQFEGVLARFPLGNKVPDALLKLGICQQKLGNPQKAKTYFDKLAREYPRSEAARRIPAVGGSVGGTETRPQ